MATGFEKSYKLARFSFSWKNCIIDNVRNFQRNYEIYVKTEVLANWHDELYIL